MRRLNLPLVIGILLFLVGGAAGLALLNRYQVRRNAESIAVLAATRIEEGREAEAIGLLQKYLVLRPGDAERQRQYAELLLRQAEAGRITPRSAAVTIAAMETAMRAFPEDDALRERFATFLFAVNQPGMARDHFQILVEHSGRRATRPRPPPETTATTPRVIRSMPSGSPSASPSRPPTWDASTRRRTCWRGSSTSTPSSAASRRNR